VRIIAVSFLRAFWEKHPDAAQHLISWVDEVKKAKWSQPAEIKEQYRSASILKNRRVVFNIKGNDYRLVVSVAYHYQAVCVKFIGTHNEYDDIDAETVEMKD
jgi:mRNA interferase HigB